MSGNTLLTPSIIAKEALMILENNLLFGNLVHRAYKDEFVKVGSTITIPKPVQFKSYTGQTRTNQDVTENSTTFAVATQRNVSWNFNSQELTMKVDDYSKKFIKPAVLRLCQDIDNDVAAYLTMIPKGVGTPGTNLSSSSLATFNSALQKMDEAAVPQDERFAVLNPANYWGLNPAITALQYQDGVKEALRRGWLGNIGGADTFMSQNVPSQTIGSISTGTVSGASQTGSSITLAAAGAYMTLNAGDTITLDGCYEVNPVNFQAYSYLKQFKVQTTVTIASGGTGAVSILPAITISGAYQNASASPTNAGAVTLTGKTQSVTSYATNCIFHRNAIGLVTMPLVMPAVPWGSSAAHDGLSIRVIKDYDITNDIEIIRLDVLYGAGILYPELACQIYGA